ncbi:hypothetical protein FS749_002466 [Ceratobasidium sp. UAMH 11750]|nr:hypothetical protein FS749_002466 [Ceratobasidium sp. UAMH 11750]
MLREGDKIEHPTPFPELKGLANNFATQAMDKSPSKDWWRAHNAFFGLGTSKSNNKIRLWTQLKDHLKTMDSYPAELVARAAAGTPQFQSKIDSIRDLLEDFSFENSWVKGGPRRKRVRQGEMEVEIQRVDELSTEDSGNGGAPYSDNLGDQVSNMLPAPTLQKTLEKQSNKNHCARGSRSAVVDTRQLRQESNNARVVTLVRSLAGACLALRPECSVRATRFFLQTGDRPKFDLDPPITAPHSPFAPMLLLRSPQPSRPLGPTQAARPALRQPMYKIKLWC